MLKPRRFVLALATGLCAVSCADLPAVQENHCGNGFVEQSGTLFEDCDVPSETTAKTCHPAGTPNECRWYCTTAADCAQRDPTKKGWGCGTDNVCRLPKGTFEFKNGAIPSDAFSVQLGDFDGDGRQDVVSTSANGVQVDYFGSAGTVTKSIAVPGLSDTPGVGALAAKQPDDFAFHIGGGLGVMIGQKARTLEPVLNAVLSTDVFTAARMIPMRLKASPSPPGLQNDAPVAMITDKNGSSIQNFQGAKTPVPMYTLSQGPDELAGRIPVGVIRDADPSVCDQFVLAYTGAGEVRVLDGCDALGQPAAGKNGDTDYLASVKLPPKRTVLGEPFLINLGSSPPDTHPDLVVGAACTGAIGNCVEVEAAFGDGHGHFVSPNGMDTFAPLFKIDIPKGVDAASFGTYLPLALGPLNGDDLVDYVDAYGIHVSTPGTPPGPGNPADYTLLQGTGDTWTQARIGDFNRNGVLDVIAGSSDTAGIDFFNGVATNGTLADHFNLLRIPTLGGVDDFALGDFDGDLTLDLAFTAHDPQSATDDALSFVFGRPNAFPTDPVAVAHPGVINQLASTRLGAPDDYSTFTDLFVVSKPDSSSPTTNAALVVGDSARQLQAPLVFFGESGTPAPPRAAVIGRFGEGTEASGTGRGIAVLTDPPCAVWFVSSTESGGRVSLTTGDPQIYKDKPFACRRIQDAAAFNPTGAADKPEKLVFSGAYVEDPTSLKADLLGGMALASYDAKTGKFIAEPPFFSEPRTLATPIRSGDLDGDGFPDLAAVVFVLKEMPLMGTPEVESSRAVVFWNDGTGKLGAPETLPLPAGQVPYDLALVRSGARQDRQLVVLALPDFETFASTAYLFTPNGKSFAGGKSEVLDQIGAARALTAGDVNGDGVDDLVVAEAGAIKVYQGVATHP